MIDGGKKESSIKSLKESMFKLYLKTTINKVLISSARLHFSMVH